MAYTTGGEGARGARLPGSENPGWIRIVALVLALLAFAFIVVRFVKKDVVSSWKVLASCPTVADIGSNRVSYTLDTSACLTPPDQPRSPRGWPVVTFALPPDAGGNPTVTGISSPEADRTLTVDYEAAPRSESAQMGGNVLVYVEIQPDALPATPFTIHDAIGTTTVTQAPAAETGQ